MKSVGMITIYRKNYGAFLQAYALQQTLKKLGCKPEIIRYDYYIDHTILGLSLATKPSLKKILKYVAVETLNYFPHRERQKVFDASVAANFDESKQYYKTYAELEKDPPEYDVYLTGSDQVFNPLLSPQARGARLLCFPKRGIKASYAASAGSNEIPEAYRDIYAKALHSFACVSVREAGLAEFMESALGIHALCHIDPVFLLTAEEWSGFARPVDGLPEKYILYYRVLPQAELNKTAQALSEKTGLPIFVADGHDVFPDQVKRTGFLSPEQWVYALSHAAYVVTNSFHGTAFSVNFNQKAAILIPPKGGTRVSDLMNLCGIEGADSGRCIVEDPADYQHANIYLQEARDQGISYLRRILETAG